MGAEVYILNITDVNWLCLGSYKLQTYTRLRILEFTVLVCNADTLYLKKVHFSLVCGGHWLSDVIGPEDKDVSGLKNNCFHNHLGLLNTSMRKH